MDYSLKALFQELQSIDIAQPENKILNAVTPVVKKYITNADHWFEDRFYKIDETQGFGSHLIAQNADHTLAVIITSWPSHRETPPHDHDTWAVIGCVKGVEKNTLWQRHDDGDKPNFAHITRGQETLCQPGDVISMQANDIHTVVNPKEGEVSVSLHVYGKHFNHTNRHQYDPANNLMKPFIVRQG